MAENAKLQRSAALMRLMMAAVMISSMNATLFHVALPQISAEFQLTLAQTSWLSSAYTLIYAFGAATYGKLADRFQLKTLLTFGIVLFAAGSLVGLASGSFAAALLGRCLQSAGAAAMPAAALIIPVRYFPPERRGSAIGMTAAGVALGSALAPFITALITSIADWRWLFLPSLLMPALLPRFRKYLEYEPKETRQPFDWIGGILFAAALALILVGVTDQIRACLAAAILPFSLFLIRIRKAKFPFIDPMLFENKAYVVGLLLIALISGIGISLYIVPPILFAHRFHMDTGLIGFAMVPAAAAAALLGRKGGKLADRKGNGFVFAAASGSLIACFLLLSSFSAHSAAALAIILMLGNSGQTFMQTAMANTVSKTLPASRTGAGMGLYSMTGFISQGIGTVIYGLAAERHPSIGWNPLYHDADGIVFSNLFLLLAVLHAGIFIVFRWFFVSK